MLYLSSGRRRRGLAPPNDSLLSVLGSPLAPAEEPGQGCLVGVLGLNRLGFCPAGDLLLLLAVDWQFGDLGLLRFDWLLGDFNLLLGDLDSDLLLGDSDLVEPGGLGMRDTEEALRLGCDRVRMSLGTDEDLCDDLGEGRVELRTDLSSFLFFLLRGVCVPWLTCKNYSKSIQCSDNI